MSDGYLCLLICFTLYSLVKLKSIMSNSCTRIIAIASRHLHHLPLLQSYLASSPFTLMLNVVWESVYLALLSNSGIPWSHRFKAVYLVSYRNDDTAARTALKRNLFSLLWTSVLFFHRLTFSGAGKGLMIIWTFASFTAMLVPFLVLFSSSAVELNALQQAVAAQEIGDEQGQQGEFLGHLVNMPPEWRRNLKQLDSAHAFWVHFLLSLCILAPRLTTTLDSHHSDAKQTLTAHEPTHSQYLPAIAVPLAFTLSLALALSVTWLAPAVTRIRCLAAFCGTLCFAHILDHMGLSLSWSLWLGCDALLWVFDECVLSMQTERIVREFEDLVDARLHRSKYRAESEPW